MYFFPIIIRRTVEDDHVVRRPDVTPCIDGPTRARRVLQRCQGCLGGPIALFDCYILVSSLAWGLYETSRPETQIETVCKISNDFYYHIHMSSVFVDGEPELDASRSRSGILTPSSDTSLNRRDTVSSPALKRRREDAGAAMELLLKPSIVVKVSFYERRTALRLTCVAAPSQPTDTAEDAIPFAPAPKTALTTGQH